MARSRSRFAVLVALASVLAFGEAIACDAASPSFHDTRCNGTPKRTRAMISNGSLVVMGASLADAARTPLPDTPPFEAELRNYDDQPPVRVVGPRFLPVPEAAIDWQAPGRTPGR